MRLFRLSRTVRFVEQSCFGSHLTLRFWPFLYLGSTQDQSCGFFTGKLLKSPTQEIYLKKNTVDLDPILTQTVEKTLDFNAFGLVCLLIALSILLMINH